MGKKSEKRYKDSPSLERGDNGKMAVSKKKVAADNVGAGTEGVVRDGSQGTEGMPVFARQALEREQMHGRHQAEHASMDYGAGGDKAEMVTRHAKEMADMNKRHTKDMKVGSMKGESAVAEDKKPAAKEEKTGETEIKKIEKE